MDFLFIENVGNLVCPSSYDLGEDLRLVLISVTEGEDKPLKYPTIFNSADVAIVTKVDLAATVEFSWETAYNNIQAVRPGMPVLRLSAKTGEGMENCLGFLKTGHSGAPGGSSVSKSLPCDAAPETTSRALPETFPRVICSIRCDTPNPCNSPARRVLHQGLCGRWDF